MKRLATAAALLLMVGCAARQPRPKQEYVYKPDLLVPPGGVLPSRDKLNVRLGKARLGRKRGADCAIHTETLRLDWNKGTALLHMDIKGSDDPTRMPLSTLEDINRFRAGLVNLERNGCLKFGEASQLLTRIVESLALPSRTAYNVRHGNVYTGYVDVIQPLRMKIVVPLREGVAVGFETAWYRVEGGRLIPERAEKSVRGVAQPLSKPDLAVVDIPSGSRYYRIFFLTRRSANDHDILLLTATTSEQLERNTGAILEKSEEACRSTSGCLVVPQGTAVAAEVPVMAQGRRAYAPISGTVNDVLRSAGVRQPNQIKDLQVTRPFGKSNIPVILDSSSGNLLGLTVIGGEQITWQ